MGEMLEYLCLLWPGTCLSSNDMKLGAMKTKTNFKGNQVRLALLSALCAAGTQLPTNATSVTIDQILADAPAGLSGVLDMVAKGNTLTITLQNTSITSEIGANALLTGLAFNLPSGLSIASGSASIGGSFVNFNPTPASLKDVSGEWGFANGASGHFNGLDVDALVSTMAADTSGTFGGSSLKKPDDLAGPDFGLLAKGGNAGGLAAISDSILITLNLTGTYSGDLVGDINSGVVAVTFGSPTGVPDGGATLVLLSAGLLGLAGVARNFKK